MKIALVSMNASPSVRPGGADGGGQSVYVDGLARALSQLGHTITIYARRDDPGLPQRLVPAAHVTVELLEAGPPVSLAESSLPEWIAAFGAELGAALQRAAPDVVHAQGWQSAKAALVAARPSGVPVLATFHTLAALAPGRRDEASVNGRLQMAEETAVVRGVQRIVATSSAQLFTLMGRGASPGAIKLVPCGVDPTLFSPGPPIESRPADRLRLVTLGRLAAAEGAADVIEALSYVQGVELAIGGGRYGRAGIAADPDVLRLQTLARYREVANRVQFWGRIERVDTPKFLQSADIVVCAPRQDSIGTVALEAMACGIPVIVSAVGGLADAVADGMTGIHVPPRAPRQLAYAIEELKSDPQRRERFGRFGVERIAARYRWSRIAVETFEIYRSVAAGAAVLTHSAV